MNLLIFNLKNDLNDSALAHSALLVDSLAKKFDNVFVISGYIGKVTKSKNITYYSIINKKKPSRLVMLIRFYFFLFKILIWNRKKLKVFAHMAPLYALLASPFLRILNIPITLWYAHRQVTLTLKLASCMVNKIVTSYTMSFRVKTKTPIHYIGQGVYFPKRFKQSNCKITNHICIHGRLAEVKNIHVLIESLALLRTNFGLDVVLNIYGECLTKKDLLYKERLKEIIRFNDLGHLVNFHGAYSLFKIPSQLEQNIIALNLTTDWSVDKSGIEALAIGIPLIYANSAYNNIFEKYMNNFSKYFVKELNPLSLAQKIFFILSNQNEQNLPLSFIKDIRKACSINSQTERLFAIIMST